MKRKLVKIGLILTILIVVVVFVLGMLFVGFAAYSDYKHLGCAIEPDGNQCSDAVSVMVMVAIFVIPTLIVAAGVAITALREPHD